MLTHERMTELLQDARVLTEAERRVIGKTLMGLSNDMDEMLRLHRRMANTSWWLGAAAIFTWIVIGVSIGLTVARWTV